MRRIAESVDDADYSHENKRDKLDDCCRRLEFARELGRNAVYNISHAEIEHHYNHAFRSYYTTALCRRNGHGEIRICRGEKYKRITCGNPCENACHGRVIDKSGKPAHIVSIFAAHESLGIVDYTVYLFEFLCHAGEREQAEEHYRAADEPCKYAYFKVASRGIEDVLRLEEDAGTDNYADNHTYGCKQPVLFSQFVFH